MLMGGIKKEGNGLLRLLLFSVLFDAGRDRMFCRGEIQLMMLS
jgi:hypothetical protein